MFSKKRKTIILFFYLLLLSHLFAKEKILIIHSYNPDISWVQDQTSGIKSILSNKYEYYEFYMNTKQIPKNKFKEKADEALQYYKRIKPNLVITTDDNALKLVGQQISKNTPLVFGGVNGHIRNDYPWILKNLKVTGVLERPLIKRSIFELKKGFNIKGKVLILLGVSPTAKAFYDDEMKENGEFKNMIESDIFISGNFEEWKKVILSSKEKGYSMLMIAGNQAMHDSNKKHINANYISQWISSNSPIPPFTIHSDQIGKNLLIGGTIINGVSMGKDTGRVAKYMLNQKSHTNNRIQINRQIEFKFSNTELEKWKLANTSSFRNQITLID